MTNIIYTEEFLKEEVSPDKLLEACQGSSEALLVAFEWASTPQGDYYWNKQWENLSPLDTKELQNMLDQYNYIMKRRAGTESSKLFYDFDKMEVFDDAMEDFLEGDFWFSDDESFTNDEPEGAYDPVDKPVHYNMGGIECIDYIKQVLGLDGFIAYCHGNMIKYQHRYRYKQNPREDMKKAQWYLNKMNEALEEKYK